MPETEIVFFAEEDGSAPLLKWLDALEKPKARDKCIVRIERLAEIGYELTRPEADFLRDGIYELRTQWEGVQYRMLYFFVGPIAVISHGCLKRTVRVPEKEIAAALERKARYERNPEKYSYRE